MTGSPACVVPVLPAFAQIAPADSGPIGSADTLFATTPPRWALLRHRLRWPLAITIVLVASLLFFSTRKVDSTAAPASPQLSPSEASTSATADLEPSPSPSPSDSARGPAVSPAAFVAPEPVAPAVDPTVAPAPTRIKSRSKRPATKRARDTAYDLPF